MNHFPLFFDLKGRKILCIGGGRVAGRRVSLLAHYGAVLTVIAPAVSPDIHMLSDEHQVIRRTMQLSDITSDYFVVLAATDDSEVNEAVGRRCKELNIPVNVASNHHLCDFYFPAVIEKSGAVIGIVGNGVDHIGVKRLKEKIDELMNDVNID